MAQLYPGDGLLPHDISAEEAVLGAIIMVAGDPQGLEWIEPVYSIITPLAFYRERNGWIFDACLKLRSRGIGIDIVTLESELSDRDRLADIGGPAYLSYLNSRTPTPYHGPYYAEIVKDRAERRRTIEEAGRLAGKAYEGGDSFRKTQKPGFEGFDV